MNKNIRIGILNQDESMGWKGREFRQEDDF